MPKGFEFKVSTEQSKCQMHFPFATTTTAYVMYFLLFKKKYPVDFDDELRIGDVRYDDMT